MTLSLTHELEILSKILKTYKKMFENYTSMTAIPRGLLNILKDILTLLRLRRDWAYLRQYIFLRSSHRCKPEVDREVVVLIPPAPRGFKYTPENSKEIARHFAIAGLANIIRKVSNSSTPPLRWRNIRSDAHSLLMDIVSHRGTWTAEWAEDLQNIVSAARKSGVLQESK